MISAIEAPSLSALQSVKHGFFTRQGGVSVGGFSSLNCRESAFENPRNVQENRARVARFMGCAPDHLVSCQQIHSTHVLRVETQDDCSPWPEGDAMVTNRQGIALGILTADCAPVLFADEAAGVIGAAHAGWRGALMGIVEETVEAMIALGARRDLIRAAIGPCIGQTSYEVGPEFPAPFLEYEGDNKRFFVLADRRGHFLFDLPGFVCAKLKAAGISAIDPSPADTCADEERFFSHRRGVQRGERDVGRLISTIMLTQ